MPEVDAPMLEQIVRGLRLRVRLEICGRADYGRPTVFRNPAPVQEGRVLAAGITGSQFVELDSKNHVLLEDESAWPRFCETVLDFAGLGAPPRGEDPAFASLSPRERDVLSLMTEGLGNAGIAERLAISEKTVRNHTTNLFDKLGVWTRAQAIVLARDRGFRHEPRA